MAKIRIETGDAPIELDAGVLLGDMDVAAMYNNGAQAVPIQNRQVGNVLDIVPDNNLVYVWAMGTTAGQEGAAHCLWLGANQLKSGFATEDPFSADDIEEPGSIGVQQKNLGWWGRLTVVECTQVLDIFNATSPDTKTGFGLGVVANAVATIPASPTTPLALIYARFDTAPPQWEILLARGNSTPAAIKVLTGVPAPSLFSSPKVTLVFDGRKQKFSAYIGGQLGAEIIDPVKFPLKGGAASGQCGYSVFGQSGTAGGAQFSNAWWNQRVRVFR